MDSPGPRPSSDTAGSQPWASGRVLTASQRERKRLVDRNARRSQKQKFLERIGQLEARVQELESGQPSQTSAANAPAGSTKPEQPAAFVAQDAQPSPQDPSSVVDTAYPIEANATSQQYPSYDTSTAQNSLPESPTTFIPALNALCSEIAGVIPLPLTMRQEGREVTQSLNSLVHYIRNIPTESVCFDEDCNQDFLVRYVLEGWQPAVSRYEQTCPLWLILRMVDLFLFKHCPTIERVAILRMLHRMYLFEISSRCGVREPLPMWYKPQASQQVIKHDPVVDHMAWPRLRERLTVQENNTLTNAFWSVFARNFHFVWQRNLLDALQLNRPGGRYGISGVFETALHEISSWRMDPSFIAAYPSLAGDVVLTEYMPLNKQPDVMTQQQQQYPRLIAPRFGRRGQLTLNVRQGQADQSGREPFQQQHTTSLQDQAGLDGSNAGFMQHVPGQANMTPYQMHGNNT